MNANGDTNNGDLESQLLQPYDYLVQVPGKQIRGKLLASFNQWLEIPAAKLEAIGEVVQMLHNASLLLGDVS